ncbi:MAG: response regulator [Verrucomicrobiota bacterium]
MNDTAQLRANRAKHILLVDDDEAFSGLFKDFLINHQPGAWIVHTADHYGPALTCLKEHRIDLIVLDLNMPVMDGLQLLSLIKRTHPAIPVVMFTGVATAENRASALKNGAALFLDKTEVAGDLKKIYAALDSIAAAPTEGFRGMLRQVGLPDVLQMECLNRKSSVLEVSASSETGRIFIEDGSVIHAESHTQQGEPALFQLLALSGGEFQLKPFTKPPRQTIDGHWESLLMEGARLRDEATAKQPAPAAPAAEPEPAPPPEATVMRVPAEIVLCSATGELLYEWQPKVVDRRIQLLDLIANIALSFSKTPLLVRGERLEVESADSRSVLLIQPDRRLFVQSVPKK